MFEAKRDSVPLISAYEDVSQRETQWWANDGLYMGFKVAPAKDETHPLRGDWQTPTSPWRGVSRGFARWRRCGP